MLKSIEIWDFESHEHTLVDDLSEGLNTIVGESNAGKTSIVRALRLVAYNDFDPESVRVGAKFCVVKVATDKGIVKVTRGKKDNLWEIWVGREEKGKPDFDYDKVGRVEAPPKAVEIIGLSVVRLGDVSVPVNIMDQLESHFMLAGIGDDKATGSVRAQIIDEISGLSGIEAVIKGVSLDNHRAGREMKQIEVRVNETSEKLHDDGELDQEGSILDSAKTLLEDREEAANAAYDCKELAGEWESTCKTAEEVESKLASIPDVKRAGDLLEDASDASGASEGIRAIRDEFDIVEDKIETCKGALTVIPDTARAANALDIFVTSRDTSRGLSSLCTESETVASQISDCKSELEAIPDTARAAKALDIFEKNFDACTEIGNLHCDYLRCCKEESECKEAVALAGKADKARPFIAKAAEAMDASDALKRIQREELDLDSDINELEIALKSADVELAKATKECNEILQSFTVCPLTLAPVSKECLKEAKV